MAFDPSRIRLERFKLDVQYHAAYDFFSFKGVLGERYAHGPKFGAFVDQGSQVKLTPEGGFKDDRAEAMFGMRGCSFDQELVDDPQRTYEEARLWTSDVLEVLQPKRITRVIADWFPLYPLSNRDAAEAASKRLRVRYYNKDRFDELMPDYETKLGALSSMCLDGDKRWSIVLGVVGPPHKNQFFGVPDEQRDENWWMGLNFHITRFDEGGLVPEGETVMPVVEQILEEGVSEYERLIPRLAI